MKSKVVVTMLALVLTSHSAGASDLAREKRMADEIVDSILDGDAVYLKSGDHEFLNIYTETDMDTPKGAVMVLHGRGYHPDWGDVVQPLRVGLAEAGWNTLSMQMPVLEKNAKYYDYVPIFSEAFPRIEAGVEYLKQQGNKNITIIAHSCSVHMVMAWIDAGQLKDINAFVGIGMGATDYKQPMAKPFPLEKISIPVLDVYGADEYPAVLRAAASRYKAIQLAGNRKSRQVKVPGADHYFSEKGDELLRVVSDWLESL